MAFEGTFKSPSMVINGELTVISREIWGQRKLSAEDFVKFTAAIARDQAMWDADEASGAVTRTPVFETVDGKIRTVGSTVSISTHHNPDEEYATFMRQYLSDPDVIWPEGSRKPVY
jgi:hypothetical protein